MPSPGPTDPADSGGEVGLHGVFLALRLACRSEGHDHPISKGVLILGEPGVGKSELALDLISRGHALVADDSPRFSFRHGRWTGHCPFPLQDFLEVRGLGILNVRRLFGDEAVCKRHTLDLVIRLDDAQNTQLAPEERLHGAWRDYPLGQQVLPELPLPVRCGRNLALLVETAARMRTCGAGEGSGYNAANELSHRLESSISTEERNRVKEARELLDPDAQNLGKDTP